MFMSRKPSHWMRPSSEALSQLLFEHFGLAMNPPCCEGSLPIGPRHAVRFSAGLFFAWSGCPGVGTHGQAGGAGYRDLKLLCSLKIPGPFEPVHGSLLQEHLGEAVISPWHSHEISTNDIPNTVQKSTRELILPRVTEITLVLFFFFPFLPFLQMQSREPDRLSKFCNLKVELWFLFQWLSQKQHSGKNPRLEPSWLVLWSWASHLTSGSPGPFICKQGSRIEFLWWSLLVLMTWFLKADFFLFSHQRSEAERGGEGTACLDQSVASQSPRLLPVEVTHLASYQVRDRGMWGWKTLVDSEVEIDQYLWRTYYLGPEHDLVTGEQETIIQKKEGIKTHNKKKLISCPQKTHILIVQQSITFLNPDSVLTNECEINGLFNSLLKW